jgi:hypothetical protein
MTRIVRNDRVIVERRFQAKLEKRHVRVPLNRIAGTLSPRFA